MKALMNEGKTLLDRAVIASDIEDALKVFDRAISRNSNSQFPQANQLMHLRGQCHFRLRQFEQAEKDFQEAILISDDKNKVTFYNSLGKCKMQLALKDSLLVLIE